MTYSEKVEVALANQMGCTLQQATIMRKLSQWCINHMIIRGYTPEETAKWIIEKRDKE